MVFGSFNAMLAILGLILCGLNVLGGMGIISFNISWVLATFPFWGGIILDVIIVIIFVIIKIANHEYDE